MRTAAGDKTRETRTRWGKYISIARIPTSLGRGAGATSWLVDALRGTVMFAVEGFDARCVLCGDREGSKERNVEAGRQTRCYIEKEG